MRTVLIPNRLGKPGATFQLQIGGTNTPKFTVADAQRIKGLLDHALLEHEVARRIGRAEVAR